MDPNCVRRIKAPLDPSRVYRGQALVAQPRPDGQVKVGGKL